MIPKIGYIVTDKYFSNRKLFYIGYKIDKPFEYFTIYYTDIFKESS